MSKINPVQAAALSAPVDKVTPANKAASGTKVATPKSAPIKTPATKATAVKPATKPVIAKAAPVSSTAKAAAPKKKLKK